MLLDALALLRDRPARPIVAVVAGDGPLEAQLRRRVADEQLPARLLGVRGDVPDLLAAADVVVVPSSWEGQPLIVQEALRAGCAIVATDVGGTREVTGDAARLVPPGDASALAVAVAAVARRSRRRGRPAGGGRGARANPAHRRRRADAGDRALPPPDPARTAAGCGRRDRRRPPALARPAGSSTSRRL